jgi:hypothetical protein
VTRKTPTSLEEQVNIRARAAVRVLCAALHQLPAKSRAHLRFVVREALDDEDAEEWLADMIQDELDITGARQALRSEGLL